MKSELERMKKRGGCVMSPVQYDLSQAIRGKKLIT